MCVGGRVWLCHLLPPPLTATTTVGLTGQGWWNSWFQVRMVKAVVGCWPRLTHTHTHARKYIEARNVTISMRLSQQSMWPNHHSILAWLHLSCGCVGVCVNEWVGWLQCVCAYPKTPANKAGSFSKDSAQYGFMYHRQQDLS